MATIWDWYSLWWLRQAMEIRETSHVHALIFGVLMDQVRTSSISCIAGYRRNCQGKQLAVLISLPDNGKANSSYHEQSDCSWPLHEGMLPSDWWSHSQVKILKASLKLQLARRASSSCLRKNLSSRKKSASRTMTKKSYILGLPLAQMPLRTRAKRRLKKVKSMNSSRLQEPVQSFDLSWSIIHLL